VNAQIDPELGPFREKIRKRVDAKMTSAVYRHASSDKRHPDKHDPRELCAPTQRVAQDVAKKDLDEG